MLARRRILFTTVVAAVVLLLVGIGVYFSVPPKPGITRENFLRIHKGMPEEQVRSIFGSMGEPRDFLARHTDHEMHLTVWNGGDGVVWIVFDEGKADAGVFDPEHGLSVPLGGEPEGLAQRVRRWVNDWTGW
jgi:hypothetical protein